MDGSRGRRLWRPATAHFLSCPIFCYHCGWARMVERPKAKSARGIAGITVERVGVALDRSWQECFGA